jgi:TonB family protein
MENIFIYFVKVNVALALLYGCYKLFSSNDTFFNFRRAFLAGIYLLALTYPFISIEALFTNKNLNEIVHTYAVAILPEISVTPEETAAFDWKNTILTFLLVVYFSGIVILTIKWIIAVTMLVAKIIKLPGTTIDGLRICLLPEPSAPHSFFGWIFIYPASYDKNELSEILIHEETHVRQYHSFDIMFGELIRIICWINPFAWLLKQEICIDHEFIADRRVIRSGYDKKSYQYSLLGNRQSQIAREASIYNHFNVLQLKKRIIMLNKKESESVKRIKYIMYVPVIIALLFVSNIDSMARVAGMLQPLSPVEQPVVIKDSEPEKVYEVVEQQPEYVGGVKALMNYLNENIKYPEAAKENGIKGRVTLKFIVRSDGSVTDAKILRGVDPVLDDEALRVVNAMPKWTPGKQNGENVSVYYTLPVVFSLSTEKPKEKKEVTEPQK